MTPAEAALTAGAGLLAGAVNAVAGGGTLITFPALLSTGMPAITANITSSVGLLSGYAGGSVAYRRELAGQGPRFQRLGLVSLVGGVGGAVLLLVTPAAAFRMVVPFLILISCGLLAVQPRLAAALRHRGGAGGEGSWRLQVGVLVGAAYGSYFGAGLGVLLLALLGVLLRDELQRLNALKGLLSLVINVSGVAVFVVAGRVAWGHAAILAVTAYAGGTLGVVVARRLPAGVLRFAVVTLGVVVAGLLLVPD